MLTVRNTRTGFFEEPEFRAVLARRPEHLKPMMEFAYLTGWRMGEILRLEWRQVDFQAGTVRLEPGTTKNDEGRIFPFTGRIIPWVFHLNGKPLTDFRKGWKRACRAAGTPGRPTTFGGRR